MVSLFTRRVCLGFEVVFAGRSARLFSSYVVNLTDDCKKVELIEDGEDRRLYHGSWLRHNCRCPECYCPLTNMIKRKPYPFDSNRDKELESAHIQDSNVFVKWRHTDHEGVFPLQWLKDNDYSSEQRRRERHSTAQQPLVAKDIPVNDFSEIMSSDEGTYRWLRDVNYYGLSLIKGIAEPETASSKLATKFPNLLPYYGQIYTLTHKEDFDDIGLGTDELPSHQDLLYFENPPGMQFFNCLKNDPCVEGGENVISDLYPVVELLRTNYPESFKILTSTPVTFQRIIMGNQEQMDIRRTARHIQLDRFGQVEAINWNLAHLEPLCVREEEVDSYYDALHTMEKIIEDSFKFYHRLVPGECIVFNNRRMTHGRTRFHPNGGRRHFDGFYVHADYLRSQFLVLGKKLGKNEPSANIFMNSSF